MSNERKQFRNDPLAMLNGATGFFDEIFGDIWLNGWTEGDPLADDGCEPLDIRFPLDRSFLVSERSCLAIGRFVKIHRELADYNCGKPLSNDVRENIEIRLITAVHELKLIIPELSAAFNELMEFIVTNAIAFGKAR
jgi:hypothetical protein